MSVRSTYRTTKSQTQPPRPSPIPSCPSTRPSFRCPLSIIPRLEYCPCFELFLVPSIRAPPLHTSSWRKPHPSPSPLPLGFAYAPARMSAHSVDSAQVVRLSNEAPICIFAPSIFESGALARSDRHVYAIAPATVPGRVGQISAHTLRFNVQPVLCRASKRHARRR